MINILPSQYLAEQGSLDEVSVTELEQHISLEPNSYLYSLVLAKKMNQPYYQNMALKNSDYVYRTFGFYADEPIPQFKDLENINFPINEAESYSYEKEAENTSSQKSKSAPTVNFENSIHNDPQNDNEMTEFHFLNRTDSEQNIDSDGLSNLENHDLVPIIPDQNVSRSVNIDASVKKISKKKSKKNKKNQKFKLNEFAGITSYSRWLLSFKRNDVEDKIAKEKKAQRKRHLAEIAKKSVTKSDTVVSEPLADLLAQQGHFDDAKKMYQQLMHKNPEKSRYFAAKIEDLLKI